ncbi:hypothetical protein C8J37_11652 [Rhizobium sp. PP-WC-1G-195]|nr:hypothetical protein C8J37_11652 [Rhizobium sp. PP-WC-1G-195]
MSKEFVVSISPDTEASVIFATSGGSADPKPWGVEDTVLERASDTFASAMGMIRHIGECAGQQLANLKAESVEVTVGLNLNAKGKFVVAEASATASVEVKFSIKTKGTGPEQKHD